jgi:AcrR family transcriptional regulator
MVDIVAESGLAEASVANVVGRSGVSRRTFYEIFVDRENCFLAALEETLDRAGEHVLPAYEQAGPRWRERMRAGLAAILSFLDHEPAAGRLLIVESLAAGPRAQEHRRRALERLTAAVDAGRAEAPVSRAASGGKAAGAGGGPPDLVAEGVVGAVLSVLHGRLFEDRRPSLVELTSPLMGMVVLPYLGPAAARQEAARPSPKLADRPRAASRDPLREVPMRLTYRTVMVLLAVGSSLGASNRQIGLAAGVADQGQISKLLARLARLELIANSGEGHERGGSNAWTLTEKGVAVERLLRV